MAVLTNLEFIPGRGRNGERALSEARHHSQRPSGIRGSGEVGAGALLPSVCKSCGRNACLLSNQEP